MYIYICKYVYIYIRIYYIINVGFTRDSPNVHQASPFHDRSVFFRYPWFGQISRFNQYGAEMDKTSGGFRKMEGGTPKSSVN